MKIKLALSVAIFLSQVSNLSAAERFCFGQVPPDTDTNLLAKISVEPKSTYYAAAQKCASFYPYYAGHVSFLQSACSSNVDKLTSDQGYAPLGVFFRGWESTPKAAIAKYEWKIRGPIVAGTTPPELASYESFNAAYVFDKPGEYEAQLTVTDNTGKTSTQVKKVSVWERKGNSYYVDSLTGDDRFNGLSQTVDSNCNVTTSAFGTCAGPWKTATRAFGELAPYAVKNYPSGKYTADSICAQKGSADIVRYKQGNFKIFRSSNFVPEEALKDSSGNYLPSVPTEICLKAEAKRETKLRPGDRVLFKKGQTFDLETAYNKITAYTVTSNGIVYNYERLDQEPITSVGHWTKAIGVHFGAYGDGAKPMIKNTGKASSTAIQLQGVGMMGLAFSDLSFDLSSNLLNAFNNNRATFLLGPGNPVNLVFNNIEISKMDQGILLNSGQGYGAFVFNSKFYDSNVTQFYSQDSLENVALVGNTYDYSANHLIYSSIDSGLIVNNNFTKPAFGRTAFRLAGDLATKPNRFVWISGNTFSGWIDPRTSAEYGPAFADGKRYNYLLVHLGPNVADTDRFQHDIVFAKNRINDAETMLGIGAAENLTLKDNIFATKDASQADRVILNQSYSRRPLHNVNISSNKFVELNSTAVPGITTSVLNLQNYSQLKCSDQFNNQAMNIDNNEFYLPNAQRRMFSFTPLKQGVDINGVALPDLTLDQAEKLLTQTLTLKNNRIYSAVAQNSLIQVGGDFRSYDPKDLVATNWTYGYSGITSSGLSYRLFNLASQLLSNLGSYTWGSTTTTTSSALMTTSSTSLTSTSSTLNTTLVSQPKVWTWDELIKFAEDNGLAPGDVEALIVQTISTKSPSSAGRESSHGLSMDVWRTVKASIAAFITNIMNKLSDDVQEQSSTWGSVKALAIANNITPDDIMAVQQEKID